MQYDGAMTETNAERYFYLHDRLGSVRQVIDEDANIENCYTYNPWGQTIGDETAETGTFFNPYRFGGYFWEPEITQYHCFRRQYDPILARFTSRDPVMGDFKEPLTLHAYLYCLNDPVNYIDPSGEFLGTLLGIGGWMAEKGQDLGKLAMGATLRDKVILLGSIANGLVQGSLNMWTGSDNANNYAKFGIGFIAGVAEVQIGMRLQQWGHPGATIGNTVSNVFMSAANRYISGNLAWNWQTIFDVGASAVIGAALGGATDYNTFRLGADEIYTALHVGVANLDIQLGRKAIDETAEAW